MRATRMLACVVEILRIDTDVVIHFLLVYLFESHIGKFMRNSQLAAHTQPVWQQFQLKIIFVTKKKMMKKKEFLKTTQTNNR